MDCHLKPTICSSPTYNILTAIESNQAQGKVHIAIVRLLNIVTIATSALKYLFQFFYKPQLPPLWLLLRSSMLMDTHPSQQYAGLQHTVLKPQQEVTRPKARFTFLWSVSWMLLPMLQLLLNTKFSNFKYLNICIRAATPHAIFYLSIKWHFYIFCFMHFAP